MNPIIDELIKTFMNETNRQWINPKINEWVTYSNN